MMRNVFFAFAACTLVGQAQPAKPGLDKIEVERGRSLFVQRCGFCHGNDARGNRAPDLVRSATVMHDENGETIGPVIRNGRPDKGMPAFPLPDADIAAITAFLHAQVEAALASAEVPENYAMERLLTGNAAQGRRYFEAHCASCHSPTGDLAGIATKYKSIDLEAAFLYPEQDAGKQAVITVPGGETVRGRIVHLDDFNIAVRDSSGVYRSFDRRHVRAEIVDPLAGHLALLGRYTDADMHNLFAYLATLTGTPSATSAPVPPVGAVELNPDSLLHPAPDVWPTYNGDYTGRRYSSLNQIDRSNVGSLTVAWAFQTHSVLIKSTPILLGGVLYFTVPNNVWAVDARTGRRIWHYEYVNHGGDLIGHRGLAVYKDWLYFETPDCYLICLNAKDGTQRWKVQTADVKLGYFSTMAPLVVKNHIIAGVSGDATDVPGYLLALDPETGAVQWRWNTEPKRGEPGSETWPANTDAIEHGGGMTWMTGTFDPRLNLLYWGTGNPNPVLAGDARPGDNLYTCSIVALNPDTGKLVWHFQPSPHDTHDWDAVQTPVLFDGEWNGGKRALLAQASRNGYFFVLDRATGEHLLTAPFIETNWAAGIDKRGEPIPNRAKEPRPDGTLVTPASDGATNWMAPSFDPDTNLFYVVARRIYSVFYLTTIGKAEGWAGRDRGLWGNSAIRAIDYRTGQIRWSKEIGDGESMAGILSTAGGLLFTADAEGNSIALDAETGRTLWHSWGGGSVECSPMTYQLDGRQYVIQASGSVLYAWALPESEISR